jgi:hypothetical protein
MRRYQANFRACSGRYANSQRKPPLNIFLINERLRTFREDQFQGPKSLPDPSYW